MSRGRGLAWFLATFPSQSAFHLLLVRLFRKFLRTLLTAHNVSIAARTTSWLFFFNVYRHSLLLRFIFFNMENQKPSWIIECEKLPRFLAGDAKAIERTGESPGHLEGSPTSNLSRAPVL